MPRIVPPRTQYDPLRLVQAKAAAPAAPTVSIPPTQFDPLARHTGPTGRIQRATGGPPVAIPPTRYDPGARHQPANVVQRAAAAGAGAGAGGGSGGGQPPKKPVLPDSKTFYKAGGKPGYGGAAGNSGKTGYEPPTGKADYQPAAAAGVKHHQFGPVGVGGKGHRPPSAAGRQARHWNAAGGAAYYPNAAAGNSGYHSGARGGRGKYRGGGYNSRAAANPASAAAGQRSVERRLLPRARTPWQRSLRGR